MTKYLSRLGDIQVVNLLTGTPAFEAYQKGLEDLQREIVAALGVPKSIMDATSREISISYVVSPEKVVGQLGVKRMNIGTVITVKCPEIGPDVELVLRRYKHGTT